MVQPHSNSQPHQLHRAVHFCPKQGNVVLPSSSQPPLLRHFPLFRVLADALHPAAVFLAHPPLLHLTFPFSNPLVFGWASIQGHPPLYRATAKQMLPLLC